MADGAGSRRERAGRGRLEDSRCEFKRLNARLICFPTWLSLVHRCLLFSSVEYSVDGVGY